MDSIQIIVLTLSYHIQGWWRIKSLARPKIKTKF